MKLFLTVGAQMPFDRLVAAVDAWAGAHPEHRVIAQIGDSELHPAHMETHRFMEPPAFDRACEEADAIVGHAGIGTLFAAMERGKPVLVMPRLATRRETRNEHQSATARQLGDRPGVRVAWDEDALGPALDELARSATGGARQSPDAEPRLIEAIARFIADA